MNHHLSERRQAFYRSVRAVDVLPQHHLVRIAKERGYHVRVRAAALRVLTSTSPVEITMGRPYAERRRLVRKHYDI
jgi:hypothetical protein